MRIIGITGTLGAGKGTIVDYLINHHQFRHYSVRSYLTEKINELQLPLNRDSMVQVANGLRAEFGPDYIIKQLYAKALQQGHDAVIESIRTPGEIDALREKDNFILLAIDADPRIRYERICLRNSETDQLDFETFLANERREMNSSDPNKQNISACISRADSNLNNNDDFDSLYEQVESVLDKKSTYA